MKKRKAKIYGGLEKLFGGIEKGLDSSIHNLPQLGKKFRNVSPLPDKVTNMVTDRVREVLDFCSEYGIIGPVNGVTLNRVTRSLIEQQSNDLENLGLTEEKIQGILRVINEGATIHNEIDHLSYPLGDQLRPIFNYAFDHEIHPLALTRIMESDQVLEILIKETVNGEHMIATNALDAVRAGISLFHSKFQKARKRAESHKVIESSMVHKKLMGQLEAYVALYDPLDKEFTLAKFMKDVMADPEFEGYNIEEWFLENKAMIIEMLRGYEIKENGEAQIEETGEKHIGNILTDLYIERGKRQPKEFIRVFIQTFLTRNGDSVFLYIEALQDFFESILPRLTDKKQSISQLQELLLENCEEIAGNATTLKIITDRGYTDYQNPIAEPLRNIIMQSTPIRSSYAQTDNLFANPDQLPYNFSRWHDGVGHFDKEAYLRAMTMVLGLSQDDDEREAKMNKVFEDAYNEYSRFLTKSGIDFTGHHSFKDKISFPELVAIARDNNLDTQISFAARAIIELAMLMQRSGSIWSFVHRERHRDILEQKLGSAILPDPKGDNMLHFRDYRDPETGESSVEVIPQSEIKIRSGDPHVRSIEVEPVTLNGVQAHILPFMETITLPNGTEATIAKRIGIKSAESTNAKAIRKNESPDTQTDILRMTLLAKDINHLKQLFRAVDDNFLGFGVIKRFQTNIDDLSNAQPTQKSNQHSSSDYKASKFDAIIKARDVISYTIQIEQLKRELYQLQKDKPEAGIDEVLKLVEEMAARQDYPLTDINLEIRFLTFKALAIDKSEHHPGSHSQYKGNRKMGILSKLLPRSVYPRLWVKKVSLTTSKDRYTRGKWEIAKNLMPAGLTSNIFQMPEERPPETRNSTDSPSALSQSLEESPS